jgi:hypothetical protein
LNKKLIEAIYDTMIGSLIPQACVPGVENAFAPGTKCAQYSNDLYEAAIRLNDRLGEDDDQDVHELRSAMEDIQAELCYRMFVYGYKYGKHTAAFASRKKRKCPCRCRRRR